MKLPPKHIVPQFLANTTTLKGSLGFRLTNGPLRGLVDRARVALAERYWRAPSPKKREQMKQLEHWLGVWATTRISHAGTLQWIDAAALPADFPKDEPQVVPVFGTPYAKLVEIPPLHYAFPRGLKGARIAGFMAGGIGDLILFSQLCQSLRAQHGCTVDIVHLRTKYSDQLLAHLFAPAEVLRFPIPQRRAKQFDFVLPLGMHGVLYGEDIPAYFERAYGTTIRCGGFPIDEPNERALRRLLRIRHEMEPGFIAIHAGCRREKHYPHFDDVAKELVRRGHRVVLLGELADSALRDEPGKLANLCGLDLWQTIALLRDARLFIGPDSSFMHAAGAWNVPSLALFGPTPAFWATPYPKHTVVTYEASCRFLPCWVVLGGDRPCGENHVPPCLQQIDPMDVVTLAERKLKDDLPRLYEIMREPKKPVRRDLRVIQS